MIARWIAQLAYRYATVTRPHPGRGMLLKMADYLYPHPIPHEYWPGLKIAIRLGSDCDIAYCTKNSIARQSLSLFASLIRPGDVVVDIGANVGVYSMVAATQVGTEGVVYSFEASPDVYSRLVEHLSLNKVAVHAVNSAVAQGPGEVTLYQSPLAHSIGTLIPSESFTPVVVPSTSIDMFCRQNSVGRVDVVKIDVEGAEPLVLQGMVNTIRAHLPLVVIELNDRMLTAAGSSPEQVFTWFVENGYEGFVIDGGRTVPVPAPRRDSRYLREGYADYLFRPLHSRHSKE